MFMSIFTRAARALIAAVVVATAGIAAAQAPSNTPASVPSADNAPRKYTIFVQVKTRDAWLALTPQDRLSYIGKNVFPLLARNQAIKVRFFDAEFYTARISDMMVVETTDLRQYERFIDGLRDQEFWHKYFDVLDIFMTTENPMVDFTNARTTLPK
jgi:hypothetical protein